MKRYKIKTVLENHWNAFLRVYKNKIRFNVKKEVEMQKKWNC